MNVDYQTLNQVVVDLFKIVATSVLTLWLVKRMSYKQEKSKNIATKEDIAHITRLIEETKLSFTLSTESFKSSLALSNNVQFGIIADEKKALIEFFENIYVQMSEINKIYFNIIPEEYEIPLLQMKLLDRVSQCQKVRAVLSFYISDYPINLLAQDINTILVEDMILPDHDFLNELRTSKALEENIRVVKYKSVIAKVLDKNSKGLVKLGPQITEFQELAREFISGRTTTR